MGWTSFRRERNIRRVLRSLSGHRVVVVLKPGNVWVVENARTDFRDYEEALSTCLMRGWIDVLHEAVSHGSLQPNGLPSIESSFQKQETIYRITDSGWSVINRTQMWVMSTFAVALLALVASVLQLWRS
jgi:hypothetical protein